MENLPLDIILLLLEKINLSDNIALGLTCKNFLNVLNYERNLNPLIKKTITRIEEFRYKKYLHPEIHFERMYYHAPYHEETMLIIIAKVLFPKNISQNKNFLSNYKAVVHYTTDEWKKVKIDKMCLYDLIDFKDKNNVEAQYIGIIPINSWFAIGIKDMNSNYEHWDNNLGWNYSDDSEYHHLPIYYDINRYPFMDFYYSGYITFDIIPFHIWCQMEEI